jgi:hypothetical protein
MTNQAAAVTAAREIHATSVKTARTPLGHRSRENALPAAIRTPDRKDGHMQRIDLRRTSTAVK